MARRRRYSEQRQPDTYKVAEYEQYRRDNQPDTYRVGDYEQRRQAGEFNRRLPSIEEVHRKWDEQKARREAAETAGRQAIYDTLNRNRVNGAVANAPEAVKKTVTLDDLVKKPAEEQKQAPEMNTAMGENGPRQPFSAAAKQLQDRIDRDRKKVTKEGVTSFSSWVGSLGKDYKKGDRNVTPQNVTSYLAKREAQVQGGQFSTSRDARLHSNAQQKQDYVAAQNEAEQARKEQLQMRQWRNENLPQTEEEKQALRERSEELNAKPGTWLDVNGLNIGNINDLENIRKRPDNYFDNREEYDEFLYDFMNGNGAYNERIESIETDHEVDVLEEELDRMWDRMESGDMHLYDEENTAGQEELKRNRILLEDADYGMSKRVEQADKYVDELKEETERDAMLEQMAEQAPAAKPFDVSMNPRVLGPYQIEGDSADRAFYEVNNSWWDLDARGAAYGPQPERQDWKDEWFMSDEPMPQYNGRSEKDIFNGYYQAGRKDEAMAFLEGLRGTLKERRAKAQEYANRETARLEVGGVNIGGIAGAGTALVKPFASAMEGVDVLGSLFGVKGSGDMASQWHQLGNAVRSVRDERGEIWDEAFTAWFGKDWQGMGKKYNSALYSLMDNMVAVGAGKAISAGVSPEHAMKVLGGTIQFMMSNEAAADDFAQRVDSGMKPDEAAVYAVGQGIIEAITEKASIGALFNDEMMALMQSGDWLQVAKYLGINTFVEGSEEVASDVLSMFYDDILSTVYGHESEFMQRYHELQQDHNDQDAMRIAMSETWQQFGESFYFGALSGFVMSGMNTAGNRMGMRQAGQNIQSVDSIMENGGTQQVISAGEAMGEGSQSAKLAAELKQKAESGKRIRTGKLGRLAQNIQIESQVKAEETANKTVEDKVQAAMVDNGVDPAQAKQLAAAAREGVMNGLDSLSRGQRQAIESTEGAVEAIRQVQNDAEVAKQVRENTAKYQSAAETATNLSEGRTAEGIDPETVGQHLANEEDIRNATGDRTGGVREVIVNHEYATLDGMEQDGDGNWKYKVTSNGKTSLLDASDIKATNFSAAAVIRENAVNPKFYSGAYTNELLNQIDKGNVQNVARYLTDAYKVRWAAYLGQEMPQTQLAENQAKELYRVSMTDAAEARKAQAAERPANYRGAGKGTATFNGTEYGTEAFDKAIGDVDSETRARIDYVANLAKASGIELNLIDTAAEDYDAAVHGWENGKGIVLNLDSYDSRAAKEAGRKHHIVATMSHEMTHWLQRNNASGYLRLQSFVLDNMAREGVDVAARAENLMAQRDISMTEAIDEIVANACDQVLGNEAIANRLKETDGKLYSAIKGFVQELVKKIRSAVVGMEDSASRDARKLMYKYGNELAKIWTGVYDEVLQGKISEIEAADIKKMSMAEIDTEYLNAVKAGDMETVQRIVDEAAKRAGYTDKVYHGTTNFGFTQWDMKESQGQVFVSYLPDMASTYTGTEEIKRINKDVYRKENIDKEVARILPNDELIDYLMEFVPENGGIKIELHKADSYFETEEMGYEKGEEYFEVINRDHKSHFMKRDELINNFDSWNVSNVNGIYELYANPGNQLVVDGNGALWREIQFNPDDLDVYEIEAERTGQRQEKLWKTRDIARYAKKRGYDSVKIENIWDNGGRNVEANDLAGYGNVGIFFNAEAVKSADPIVYDDNGEIIPPSERFNKKSNDIRFSMAELDAEYEKAVASGNWKKAEQMLLDKYEQQADKGLIGYRAGYNYAGEHADIARLIKSGDTELVQAVAKEMAAKVPENAVLVPMPPHSGKVTEGTDTMILARAISKITGSPVINALESEEHISRNQAKKQGIRGVDAKSLGIRQVAEIPKGAMPVFIDNVVGGGVTAKAAHDAVGRGITLAYAQSPRGKISGAKNLIVTYDNNGKLIPLSQRMDPNVNSWKYSVAEDQEENRLRAEWNSTRDEADKYRDWEEDQRWKKEAASWVKRLNDSQKDGEFDSEVFNEYKKWEEGYVKRNNAKTEAQEKERAARKALDDYIEQRDVKAEEKAIEESGLTEPEYRRRQAVNDFGYTTNFREAGYLLPNGKLLNFCGDKGQHTGQRGNDHRQIGQIYASSEMSGSKAMIAFMSGGNIRVMAETPGIDIISNTEPTAEQYAAIKNMARRFAGEEYFNVDFTDERGNTVDSIEYDGRVNADRIVNDIKTFYRTGAAPQQSVVSQFHYSMAEDQMDVNAWMMAQTPGKFQTENERKLLQAYRDMRVKISLSLLRQTEYTKQIRALEEKQNAGTLTGEERDQLINLRNRLEIQESKQGRLEQELYEVTSSSGYAGMMYKHSRLLADQVEGKTQAQVEAAVDSMKNIAEKTAKQIQKRQKELEVLAENNGVKTIQAALKDRGLNRTVEALQTEFVTAMPANELRGRLAEIILKEVNGENITEDINDLAEDVVRRQTSREAEDATEALKMLRGRTIVIGPQQQAELKGRNSNLNEIRRRTRGSGVKFEYGDHSTLESDWMEMQSEALSVDMSNSGDSLENIVGYIEGLLNMQVSDRNEWGVDIDEVKAFLRASVGIVLNDQTGGMSKEKLAEKIRKKEGALDKALAATKETAKTAEQLLAGARKAAGWASFLRRDVQAAIDYYNETAKQAAQVERQEVRKNLIEVLQNEHTRDLIKQSEEYEERIKRDRKARELRDDNESLRKQITTTVKRMKTLLTAETDTKNIQEEAKPLARMVTEMLVRHDMSGFRKVLFSDRKALEDAAMRLDKMNQAYGEVDPKQDLDWLVIHGQTEADNDTEMRDRVMQDLMDIEQGLLEYRTAEGQGNITLQDRKNGLEKVQKAISEIYSVIKARGELFIEGKRVQVLDLAEQMREDFSNSRYKGDRRLTSGFWKSIGYGNLTPEYFFKNLRNRAMSLLHRGLQSAENRSGLEAYKARERVKQIAEETGFATWDPKEKHQVKVSGGKTVEMTTEQVMSLYATWMREKNQLRPEATAHLLRGGFVLAQNQQDQKLLERVKESSRPVRMTYNLLNELGSYLTENQRKYVDAMVQYMSTDLAELGNEASLQTYGIKKFTEKYYFPIKSWGGVLNKRSDSGVMNKNDNRAMRQSFSKRVQANASNAIEISDFTPTVVKHIVGMINFNTVGPAVENMRKVLNQQLEYGERNEEEDNTYRRNMEAAFTEAYGKNAADYLAQFMQDINGGVSRRKETSLRERLLSVFKKNAVAGSLSVAAQQPLSYIRAAMMINPKYLAAGLSPAYWKGSYKEMLTHSGVAVIKEMGKFDMNYGRSMQDYIAPDAKESKAKAAVNWISEKSTALPEKMDAMTWTRMWSACKAELKAQNPGMNVKSEEFLNKVAERFNEVMRRTQVYDSVMVKSQNMRSDSYLKKVTTSFMAEPTLSLNVLADAWQNIKEKGGKANAAKALATFLLSAAAQAGAKAFFGAGRSPDKKKNRKENWANKFTQNLLSELNVLGLIPGYSQVMDVLINGELNDDAMGVIGKGVEVVDRIFALATGKEGKGLYRDLEDSIGQMIQFATRVPAKNIMRDFRAMVNWFSNGTAAWTGTEMAQRETSNAVLKYQALDALLSTDLIGLVNGRLGEAGYGTAADDYAQRIYDAEKNKDKKRAEELRDYYINTKTSAEDPEKSLNNKLKTMVKEDAGLKYIDKIHQLRERGMKDEDIASWITKEYKEGRIEKDEAQDLYMAANPEKKQDDAFFHFAQAEWEAETGRDMNESKYFRLDDALAGDSEEDIKAAIKELTEHGVKEEDVNNRIRDQILKPYKEGNRSREETEKWLKKYRKDLKDNDIFWTLDRIDYKKETGTEDSVSGYYYRLKDALDANKAEDIKKAVSTLLKHGITKEKIKSELSRELKSKYLAAGSSERVKIKDAMQKAYKAAGYTATDADKIISGWLKDSKKKTNNTLVPQATKKPAENTAKSMPKRPASEKDWDKYMDQLDEYWQDYDFSKNDPVGRYGKGTIDMNSRKVIRNADGSISTEKSFSFYDGDTKKEILIPLIVNGKELTKQKAIDHYYETAKAGKPEYLGMFDDWKDADEYAMMLHNRGAWYYRNK